MRNDDGGPDATTSIVGQQRAQVVGDRGSALEPRRGSCAGLEQSVAAAATRPRPPRREGDAVDGPGDLSGQRRSSEPDVVQVDQAPARRAGRCQRLPHPPDGQRSVSRMSASSRSAAIRPAAALPDDAHPTRAGPRDGAAARSPRAPRPRRRSARGRPGRVRRLSVPGRAASAGAGAVGVRRPAPQAWPERGSTSGSLRHDGRARRAGSRGRGAAGRSMGGEPPAPAVRRRVGRRRVPALHARSRRASPSCIVAGIFLAALLLMAQDSVRPFIVGLLFVYLLDPPVRWLARHGIRRSIAILIVYVGDDRRRRRAPAG